MKQVSRCPPLRYDAELSSLAMSGLAFSVAPFGRHTNWATFHMLLATFCRRKSGDEQGRERWSRRIHTLKCCRSRSSVAFPTFPPLSSPVLTHGVFGQNFLDINRCSPIFGCRCGRPKTPRSTCMQAGTWTTSESLSVEDVWRRSSVIRMSVFGWRTFPALCPILSLIHI